ncbi:type II secretion system protein GspG [Clostridium sp. MSJ-11]|uniref:Type II secretion system protein GspG n=1 Tax=Clostridium mobile TaxID=2841512 RepID=A0ABS6EJW4_9CLOT|nr:prepilin-type N-terminal cleavage/methylation domain-containing protein [Clostridium mobile]MBU5485338.1 type II secretion system protein GspG [Clostridium mobile]
MKKIKRGFTLVELLVVIAIIAILAAIIAPNAFKAIEKSKVATVESDYRAIKTATFNYYTDTGKWPSMYDATLEGLFITGKDKNNNELDNWDGPYLEKLPSKNPWGGDYKINAVEDIVELEFNKVPLKVAEKIDLDLDGVGENHRGAVIYGLDGDTCTVRIRITHRVT